MAGFNDKIIDDALAGMEALLNRAKANGNMPMEDRIQFKTLGHVMLSRAKEVLRDPQFNFDAEHKRAMIERAEQLEVMVRDLP